MDHERKLGEKSLFLAVGRCNFTNLYAAPEANLWANPHFCKLALRQYDHYHFISLVNTHKIAHNYKKLGQLFFDHSSQKNSIDMLRIERNSADVELRINCEVSAKNKHEDGFHITLNVGIVKVRSLVIATGGLSIIKIGATGFGCRIAQQFKLNVLNRMPRLVPLVFDKGPLVRCKRLSGLSVDARVACAGTVFQEGLLFTHRGLSGPSILQISSNWRESHSL